MKLIAKFLSGNLIETRIVLVNFTNAKRKPIVKVESKNNPTRFLTIFESMDDKKLFGVNVTSGTIDKPSSAGNATWYNLDNRYHTKNELLDILSRYGMK